MPGTNALAYNEKFCIDVSFEMRTVLSVICLFNDKSKVDAKCFYFKMEEKEESKIVDRPRESESERQSFAARGR